MVRLGVGDLLSATAALLALLALAPAAAAQLPADAPDSAIVVVGNDEVPARAVSRAELRRIYLMRQRFWRPGRRVQPVNLSASSPLRAAFSRAVLGGEPRDLTAYWNDLYFHGTEPPATLDSERAVLLFVARTAGGVGYVRADTYRAQEPGGVRVLAILR